MNPDRVKQAALEYTLAQYGLLEKDAALGDLFTKARGAASRAMQGVYNTLTNTPRPGTLPHAPTMPQRAGAMMGHAPTPAQMPAAPPQRSGTLIGHAPPPPPAAAPARPQTGQTVNMRAPAPATPSMAFDQTQPAMRAAPAPAASSPDIFEQLRQSKPLPPASAREQYPHLYAQNPPIPHSGPAPKPRYSREEQIQMARGVMAPITPEQYGEMMAAQHGGSALEHAGQFHKIFGGRGKVAHYLLKTAARRRSQKKVAHYRLRSAA